MSSPPASRFRVDHAPRKGLPQPLGGWTGRGQTHRLGDVQGTRREGGQTRMSKRILVVLSEWGYWGEELVGPLEAFEEAGYDVDFMTPTGKRPVAISVSMDPEYVDPPLGRSVTSAEMAKKVEAYDTGDKSSVLDNPMSLADLMPERPYHSEDNFLRKDEAYFKERDAKAKELVDKYDALLIVGGSGPIV